MSEENHTNSAPKFTPGQWEAIPPKKNGKPWKVGARGKLGGGGAIGGLSCLWDVATVWRGSPQGTPEMDQANARLNAALDLWPAKGA